MKFKYLILVCITGIFIINSTVTIAEEEEGAIVTAAANKQYIDECGACHFVYPPGLLPARSWEKLFSSLGDHFGENAELDADVARSLTAYLAKNAADKVRNPLSNRFAQSIGNATPLRISETPYFKRKHREVTSRMVTDNPLVKSFSRCQVCHSRAQNGSFSEDEVNSPGFGKMD